MIVRQFQARIRWTEFIATRPAMFVIDIGWRRGSNSYNRAEKKAPRLIREKTMLKILKTHNFAKRSQPFPMTKVRGRTPRA